MAAMIENPVQDTVILDEFIHLQITRPKGLDADVTEYRTTRRFFPLK
jgi:hypothetical protein